MRNLKWNQLNLQASLILTAAQQQCLQLNICLLITKAINMLRFPTKIFRKVNICRLHLALKIRIIGKCKKFWRIFSLSKPPVVSTFFICILECFMLRLKDQDNRFIIKIKHSRTTTAQMTYQVHQQRLPRQRCLATTRSRCS